MKNDKNTIHTIRKYKKQLNENQILLYHFIVRAQLCVDCQSELARARGWLKACVRVERDARTLKLFSLDKNDSFMNEDKRLAF